MYKMTPHQIICIQYPQYISESILVFHLFKRIIKENMIITGLVDYKDI